VATGANRTGPLAKNRHFSTPVRVSIAVTESVWAELSNIV
jgi:hypothetical protein